MVISPLNSALAGMNRSREDAAQAAHRISRLGGPSDESVAAGENLVRDLVTLEESSIGYQANLAVFKTADEMVGTLLDTFA